MAEEKKEKVLIVDDDKFLLSMYAVKFKNHDFEVETALSGAEALSKLQNDKAPDIIILDLIMPGMDGYEFMAKVREQKIGAEGNDSCFNQSRSTGRHRKSQKI